jgi:quaternary ammonium compound-resistance protein SugE
MAWFVLFLAGLLEIGWAVGLKYTAGFTRPLPTVLTVVSMVTSLGLLGLSLKTLPLGTAYAIWTGVGTLGTAVLGIVLLGEEANVARLACIGLIVAGIVGLKLASSHKRRSERAIAGLRLAINPMVEPAAWHLRAAVPRAGACWRATAWQAVFGATCAMLLRRSQPQTA